MVTRITYANLPLEEGRPFGRVGIHLDGILHQKKGQKSFQLSPSEAPSPREKTIRNAKMARVSSKIYSHLPTQRPYGTDRDFLCIKRVLYSRSVAYGPGFVYLKDRELATSLQLRLHCVVIFAI